MRKLKNDEAPMAATIEASNLPVNYETTDMKSLAKSTVKCTNSIVISGIKIHMEAEGRYSLNDLHKASGDEQRHRPKYWLELNQTTELIDEILKGGITPFKNASVSNAGIPVFKPVVSKKGRYGGTYVCKELVYSYAMWISAAFALKVIRAYDVVVTGNTNEAVRIAKTTVSDRTPLRDAVNMLVGKKGLRYDDAYNMVHQRFAIDSIDELELSQIPQAVEYIHRVVLDGEFIGKQLELPTAEKQFTDEEICSLAWLWLLADKMREHACETYPALKQLESRYAGEAYDLANEFKYWLDQTMMTLSRETAHIKPNEKLKCIDALNHLKQNQWRTALMAAH